MTPYERVKLSRQRTAGVFPLPSPLDCIRYAICELAEYDDALLRLERIGDKRNNARQPDPRAELGQAFYMLLSAAVQVGYEPNGLDTFRAPDHRLGHYAVALRNIGNVLCGVLDSASPEHVAYQMDDAYRALLWIAAAHGWDVAALVDDACAAFEAKHTAVQP